MVESSEAAIKSIELQLVRVETCGKAPRPSAATSPQPRARLSSPGSCRASGTAGDSPVDAPSPRVTGCCLSLNGHALCPDPTMPSPCCRLCRRLCPRRHRDSEHSDRRRRRVSGPLHPHLHGLPPAVHLPDAGDHQLQSGYVCALRVPLGGGGSAGLLISGAARSTQPFGCCTKMRAEQLGGAQG